ncbi:hypothetical protein VSS74_04730 [Conexibacter stalactiti]|uniref:Secreted protein n=1 Tax=Conexibacter stalactiti TaxID=1940611 RepID=A0ABU4HJX7_9ACTN|nr:hypothetical protein [Conexibacter stalactiti]MDW5593628.1 hypothetical protein [Conexibacter stalactiti]MEC5034269.1 hypothetical protein [Conexibacter stalactiti]
MLRPTLLIALFALALGLAAASAGAATPDQIIKDCSGSATGLLQKDYSKADLRRAQKEMTGDVIEYTGCPDAIAARLRARAPTNGDGSNGSDGSGGDTGGGGGGGGFDGGTGSSGGDYYDPAPSTSGTGADGTATDGGTGTTDPAAAAAAMANPQAGSSEAVRLAGETITPGITLDGDARALPTPLIAFLVLLAAGAIGIGLPTIGRRVLARRRA